MPQKAPDDIYAKVLGMCAQLQQRGYEAVRVSAYTVRVTTPTSVYFTLSVHHTYRKLPGGGRDNSLLSVRIIGHAAHSTTTQETVAYEFWPSAFERVQARTQKAYEAIETAQAQGKCIQEATDLVRQQNVPMPKITQRYPQEAYVYLTYEHGTVRCRVRNAGTAAFALWNLRD